MRNDLFRILLIGDSSVGKSTISTRIAKHINFSDVDHMPTIGVDFNKFQTKLEDDDGEYDNVHIYLWDISGSHKFDSISKHYYNNIDGFVLVYDVSNSTSFYNIKKWLNNIKNNQKRPNHLIKILLLGNKIDIRTTYKNNITKAD